MCNIAVCERERLSAELFRNIRVGNRDGTGLAWIQDGMVRWLKGLTDAEVEPMLDRLPLPYVVHVRMATVGGCGVELAHPFPVTPFPSLKAKGAAQRVLFHNGHVGDWRALLACTARRKDHKPRGPWSDSRAVAHAVARAGIDVLRELDGNRFALLSARGVVRFGSGWTDHDGVQLSSRPWGTTTVVDSGWWEDFHWPTAKGGVKQGGHFIGKRRHPAIRTAAEVEAEADKLASSRRVLVGENGRSRIYQPGTSTVRRREYRHDAEEGGAS